jgi:hypothetical protein
MNQSHRNANWNWNSLLQSIVNQVSMQQLQRWQRKVRKTEKFLYFAKFQGRNSCKNESVTMKRELELELLTAKAINQVSVQYLQRWPPKKVRKTEKFLKFF